jgi:heat shock protein HslJ
VRNSVGGRVLAVCMLASSCSGGDADSAKKSDQFSATDVVGHWSEEPHPGGREAVSLRFVSGRTFEGSDGCNDVGGSWSGPDSAGRVALSDVDATLRSCEGTPSLELEQVRLRDSALVLFDRDGNESIRLSKVAN